MRWKAVHKDIGEVTTNSKVKINFYSIDELDILTLTKSCGCTVPKYYKSEKRLEVIYNPGSIPMHLRHTGRFTTNKSITVYYKDGTKDILSFSAIIINK